MYKVYVKDLIGQERVFKMELDSLESMYLHRRFPDCVIKIWRIPPNQNITDKYSANDEKSKISVFDNNKISNKNEQIINTELTGIRKKNDEIPTKSGVKLFSNSEESEAKGHVITMNTKEVDDTEESKKKKTDVVAQTEFGDLEIRNSSKKHKKENKRKIVKKQSYYDYSIMETNDNILRQNDFTEDIKIYNDRTNKETTKVEHDSKTVSIKHKIYSQKDICENLKTVIGNGVSNGITGEEEESLENHENINIETNENEKKNSNQARPNEVESLHCYICRVKLPMKYFILHENSITHQVLLQVHKECSLRMDEHNVSSQEPRVFKDECSNFVLDETFFCQICNEVIHIKFLDNHEESKKHKKFVTIEQILNMFLQILREQNTFYNRSTTDDIMIKLNSVSNGLRDNSQAATPHSTKTNKTGIEINDNYNNFKNASKKGMLSCKINKNNHTPDEKKEYNLNTSPYDAADTNNEYLNHGDSKIAYKEINNNNNATTDTIQIVSINDNTYIKNKTLSNVTSIKATDNEVTLKEPEEIQIYNIKTAENKERGILKLQNISPQDMASGHQSSKKSCQTNDAIIQKRVSGKILENLSQLSQEINKTNIFEGKQELNGSGIIESDFKCYPKSSLNADKINAINSVSDPSNQLNINVDGNFFFCKICQVYISDSLISKHFLGQTHLTLENCLNDKKEINSISKKVTGEKKKNDKCDLNQAHRNIGFEINDDKSICENESCIFKNNVECDLKKADKIEEENKINIDKVFTYESQKFCKICQVNVPNHSFNVAEHFSGLRHKINEKRQNTEKKEIINTHTNIGNSQSKSGINFVTRTFTNSFIQAKNNSEQVIQRVPTKIINNNENKYFCEVCQVYVQSHNSNISEHLLGAKHKTSEKRKNKNKSEAKNTAMIKESCKKTDDKLVTNTVSTKSYMHKTIEKTTHRTDEININKRIKVLKSADLVEPTCSKNIKDLSKSHLLNIMTSIQSDYFKTASKNNDHGDRYKSNENIMNKEKELKNVDHFSVIKGKKVEERWKVLNDRIVNKQFKDPDNVKSSLDPATMVNSTLEKPTFENVVNKKISANNINNRFYCKFCEVFIPNTNEDVSEHYLGALHMTNEKINK